MKNLPTVSIIIPTFNEERNIEDCLQTIFQQNYPRKKLEVWIVDNGSTDKTVELAQKYSIKLLFNKIEKDAQLSKMMGFRKLKTNFCCYLDADIRVRGKNWLKKMIHPLMNDPKIVGAFTRHYVDPKDNSLNRFLSYDLLQRDPIFKFFSQDVEKTIVKREKGYFVCHYRSGKIPPSGLCLYRRKYLLKTKIPKMEKLMELDNLEILVQAGYNKFAYVPNAGIYHYHAKNLKQVVKKRMRNIERNYYYDYKVREYTWADFSKPKDLLKIGVWVLYANLFFPGLMVAFYKAAKKRDLALLWDPVIAIVVTDITIYKFITLAIRKYLYAPT